MNIKKLEEIESWQLSRELTLKVYQLTKKPEFSVRDKLQVVSCSKGVPAGADLVPIPQSSFGNNATSPPDLPIQQKPEFRGLRNLLLVADCFVVNA